MKTHTHTHTRRESAHDRKKEIRVLQQKTIRSHNRVCRSVWVHVCNSAVMSRAGDEQEHLHAAYSLYMNIKASDMDTSILKKSQQKQMY